MSDVDYFYLHEKPEISYVVEAQPPPADVSKAEFHARDPEGKPLHQEPSLKKEGTGSFPFDVERKAKLEDSPIFVLFTFSKRDTGRDQHHMLVISLAEPAVREIDAPPEAYPGQQVDLSVIAWDARAYDEPDEPTQFEEREPERIIAKHRKEVQWSLEGETLSDKGEKIKTKIKDEHAGRWITAEAWLGEKPGGGGKAARTTARRTGRVTRSRLNVSQTGRATKQIAVPKLTLTGSQRVPIDGIISVRAEVEPRVKGKYVWTSKAEAKAKILPDCVEAGWIQGVKKSDSDLDVTIECRFTSAFTGHVYKAEHKITVTPSPQIAALREAADQGAPFCEECAKKTDETEPQVATLEDAAGAPFCEECEKKKPPEEEEQAEAQTEALQQSAAAGAPFCEECEKAKASGS